jgi:hypothetical protein
MRPWTRDPKKSAEKHGHFYELWSRRPLAGWTKCAANKLLSRRLERRRLNRARIEE